MRRIWLISNFISVKHAGENVLELVLPYALPLIPIGLA